MEMNSAEIFGMEREASVELQRTPPLRISTLSAGHWEQNLSNDRPLLRDIFRNRPQIISFTWSVRMKVRFLKKSSSLSYTVSILSVVSS